ncbi:ImmA/IrrE family metallo-endopeptidase [bacterium]|nr:ImmA/IrrE family metallo-endopeptidase [bacterium]
MGAPVSNLNPKVLKWARLASGLSESDVAQRFKKDESTVSHWESGDSAPTYAQLERLAYKIYKRPLAVFFFSEPPEEESPEHSFRTLPGFEIENLNPRARYLRREALAMKGFLSKLHGGVNESWSSFKTQCAYEPGQPLEPIANRVRSLLQVKFEEQLSWKSTNEAFEKWRDAIERVGVGVFKESFDQDSLSGFCLYDAEFPVIYVNNSNSRSRQIFSLFHELAHLIAGTGGITASDDSFIDQLPLEHQAIERFCNKFSSEVLVPSDRFLPFLLNVDYSDHKLSQIAKSFSVSREVILRKYLDAGSVAQHFYDSRVFEWNQQFLASEKAKKTKKGGGDYYATHASYLGVNYLKMALTSFYRGESTREQTARYLKIKPGNLSKLEDFYFKKVGA